MKLSTAYLPWEVFAPAGTDEAKPRVFIAPQRYIQGAGVLRHTGRYLALLKAARVGVLVSERGKRADGAVVLQSLQEARIEAQLSLFGGECSLEEIEQHVQALQGQRLDCIVAIGGGKCVDAGKGIAFRLGLPVVVIPTLASNDAPCSALSVLYTPEGVSAGLEFYPHSPAMVIVDTQAIAAASARYLVAGMGDAMATWYEASVCLHNEKAVSMVGARPTLASYAIGEVCAQTLFADGLEAARAVGRGVVHAALEKVVEANTLLSGLGFESGGLAAAHGVAQSYTHLPQVHADFLHGEMVAMGTLAQLVMENRRDEAAKVAGFFARVGLPVHLGQLAVDPADARALQIVADEAAAFPFTANMPMALDAEAIKKAILGAHEIGTRVAQEVGDAAYRGLHGG